MLVCQDMEESYRLGFQTQCPMASVYWSNGPTRNFRIGQSVAYVRHVSAKFLVGLGVPLVVCIALCRLKQLSRFHSQYSAAPV